MKRWFVAALVAIMGVIAVAAASGCGGGEDSNSGSDGKVTTLTLWTGWAFEPDKSWAKDIIEKFEAEHPDIKIEHRGVENEQFFTVVRTGMAGGKPPDLLQTEGYNNLFQFVRSDQIEDITNWYEESPDNGGRFLPNTEASITYEGRRYGMPFSVATGTQIYYNKKILEEQGIDPASLKTWDDFLAAFEQLKQAGVTPLALGNKDGWPGVQWFLPFLVRNAGADKYNQLAVRNCGYKWTDPDVVEAAQHYVDLVEAGYFSSGLASDDYVKGQALFFAGKAAFFQTGSWLPAFAKASAPPGFPLGVVKFPTLEGGAGGLDENIVQAIHTLSITKKGAEDPAKREAALTFLDWITAQKQQAYSQSRTQGIRATTGATTPETADPILYELYQNQVVSSKKAIDFGLLLPTTVNEDKLFKGSTAVTAGELSAEEWMQRVEDEAAKQKPVIKLPEQCS